ncbi:carboxypeptidase-like regulatory domain-containing protein [Candidatus Woesearchaeota archaeon]|nr:carboxypeptidase-like regulatory domain-containing protein [Candidatus Woesearchaeota archaeon]MCF7900970.1 carboxypeptidase-like regulatory domain-containing protein [Candidatus Woesearchaeota archaeon]MCF8013314.1 carboxypeptidase-like regulatory domain-containing protein [Candidatus Woesearchaeota archaeon]
MSRIKKILLITILTIIITTILLSNTIIAQEPEICSPTLPICYNHDLTETGFGAVEICGECAVCGKQDGICPEKYTDGENETDTNKTSILIKIPKNQRPEKLRENAPNIYNKIENTPNTACTNLHPDATCNKVYTKENWEDEWIQTNSDECNTNIETGLNDTSYFLVECNSVKRTAGCQWCNDPDCTANLTGLTWSKSTNQTIPDARVTVTSNYNYIIDVPTNPDNQGLFSMSGVPWGNVKITCTKKDYRPIVKDTFIQPGINVLDCGMTEAYCTPECTVPNDYGTELCRARCQGINGCSFQSTTSPTSGKNYDAAKICEDLEPGARINLEWQDEQHTTVLYLDCCSGQFGTEKLGSVKLESSDNIKNLITKTYNKKIKGEPVQVKILVYEK